ncbi:MAG: heme-binding protein [Planctomycetes bacterium]|nr:heme-binding protein [Planctomycetota bacterium]
MVINMHRWWGAGIRLGICLCLICSMPQSRAIAETPNRLAHGGGDGGGDGGGRPVDLESQLKAEGLKSLAEAALQEGDPRQGALLFYQPQLGCAHCHDRAGRSRADSGAASPDRLTKAGPGMQASLIGPDLTRPDAPVTREHLIESVLEPSRKIRRDYESWQLVTVDGRTVMGFLLDESKSAGKLRLRDIAAGEVLEFSAEEIETRRKLDVSLMPAGQVKQLTDRRAFLDLIAYLYAIGTEGPARAIELRPAHSPLAAVVPEYERQVDHAAFLREWDDPSLAAASLQQGERIYQRVCLNCHGTVEQPGSLPTSLRFSSGKFKNGFDPYRIYQTLTHGFGLMMPQTWMVPQQKYAVIYYIREHFLRPHNASEYLRIEPRYVASLPAGSTRGPDPVSIEPWSAMDYGAFLIGTYEAPLLRPDVVPNLAYKGIAVRLDSGGGGVAHGRHWSVFEHDTLRTAAVWSAVESDKSAESKKSTESKNGAGSKKDAGSKKGTGSETGTNFIDWQGIQFNGAHQVHPRITGQLQFSNPIGPGWADPNTDSFDDPRLLGRDNRRYGPLPREWGRYLGTYSFGDQVVLNYRVGTTEVLELPGAMANRREGFTRQFEIGKRSHALTLLVATIAEEAGGLELWTSAEGVRFAVAAAGRSENGETNTAVTGLVAAVSPTQAALEWEWRKGGRLCLRIPAGESPLSFVLGLCAGDRSSRESSVDAGKQPDVRTGAERREAMERQFVELADARPGLEALTRGGPRRWPEILSTTLLSGGNDRPFAVDTIELPVNNPWACQVRPTGFDFFADGDRAALCTWDGDVWLLRGFGSRAAAPTIQWQRIASGLFQPLGLKIVDDRIYLTCRDQLVVLRDLNGDGESDLLECVNSDHQVTEHFHEFAMGLQVDGDGNFYYAKSARHALPALVPHHGTLLRVAGDGSRTDILANGFRAANGVCLNPDGTFVVTDQEGHWNPKNRINWVRPPANGEPPRFYGNMMGYHQVTDSSDAAMERPLCWITNAFDRSPSELLWVTSESWEPLRGTLLNFSYGYGKAYIVPHQQLPDGRVQGGMCELPIPPFPTGIMRGRFHVGDGHLYVCGMFAWAGNATQPGGFYRIRRGTAPLHVPRSLEVHGDELRIGFTAALRRESAENTSNYSLQAWDLKRSREYGSAHYNERPLKTEKATLDADGRTVVLKIASLAPTWCMSVGFSLTADDGSPVQGVIHNTIHSTGR